MTIINRISTERLTQAISVIMIICTALLIFMPADSRAAETSNIIKEIKVEGLTRIEKEELIDLICFSKGDELNMKDLGDGIKRAFRKRVFLDIKAVSEPYNGGVRLKYIITEIPVINKITIEGNSKFSLRQLKKIMTFKEGEDYLEEYPGKAESAIINFYQRRGYPDAKVNIIVTKIDEEDGVDINIIIEEGRPVLIKNIETNIDARYLVTLSVGDVFDEEEMDGIMDKIRAHYKEKNYIKPLIGPYTMSDGNLVIPVEPGPSLKLKFKNNTVISTRKLKREVDYLENEEVNDEITAEITERIRKLYVSKGYYYAQVAVGIESGEDVITVTFIIFEGKQVVLRGVSIKGVSINQNAVRKMVSIAENKPFNDNIIKNSEEALVRFYNALGYLNMKVEDVKKIFKSDGREVDLEFLIKEGRQTKIKKIDIHGNERISEVRIRNTIGINRGSPYNLIDIGDARYRVLSLYNRSGFIDAHVNIESTVKKEEAFIKFIVRENKPSVIGKIILQGNKKTKAKIINREFTLEEGEFYNSEEITRTKQRLYKLGLFNEVSIDMIGPGREEHDKVVKDMLVSLKESNAGSIEFSLGYGDYEEFRGAVDIKYRNLGGYNRQIGFRAELSTVEEKYILNFKEPWLFNKPNVPLKMFLIKEDTRSINIETREVLYKIDKFSYIVSIEKELVKGLKAGINYEYSFTDTKDVQPDVILSKEDTGTLGIGSISPSIFYDTRDNPFDPSSGSIHGVVLKVASNAFLSETEFIKGSFRSAWFFQVYKGIVMAISFRGGAAYGFEETEELPLIERYFLGGRSTVRGYSYDTLGPKGEDDNPTGGNVFALSNLEFRFSVGKGFGLVTFVDAGEVWKTVEEVRSKLKYTAGAGLRYKTPVGPIRLDYGHKLNREAEESSGEIHFSIGHAF